MIYQMMMKLCYLYVFIYLLLFSMDFLYEYFVFLITFATLKAESCYCERTIIILLPLWVLVLINQDRQEPQS